MKKKSCCKYIKVPFLKANHNLFNTMFLNAFVVANISKFLFWKRITTADMFHFLKFVLLQIYQSSFFESESQQDSYKIIYSNCCCKYIKVPFLKANHNTIVAEILFLLVVANISKFLFWKRITTPHQLYWKMY